MFNPTDVPFIVGADSGERTVRHDVSYDHFGVRMYAVSCLFITFLLIILVGIVSQCANDPIPDTPVSLIRDAVRYLHE